VSSAVDIFKKLVTDDRESWPVKQVSFGAAPSDINDIEARLAVQLCSDIRSFLEQCLPSHGVSPGFVEFLPKDELIKENTQLLPGKVSVSNGVMVFGTAGDGGGYAVDSSSGRICLIPVGKIQAEGIQTYREPPYMPATRDNIFSIAEQTWPSIHAFMLWLEAEVESP